MEKCAIIAILHIVRYALGLEFASFASNFCRLKGDFTGSVCKINMVFEYLTLVKYLLFFFFYYNGYRVEFVTSDLLLGSL